MHILIHRVSDVGNAILAVRKESGVRQDDAAGSAGVSHVFLRELEHGKETVQFGRVLQVLDELGIQMVLEIPGAAGSLFLTLSGKSSPARPEGESGRSSPEEPT